VLAAQLGVAIERVSIVPAPVGRSHVKLSAHPDLGAAEELVVLPGLFTGVDWRRGGSSVMVKLFNDETDQGASHAERFCHADVPFCH
jgi:hypothetical protein